MDGCHIKVTPSELIKGMENMKMKNRELKFRMWGGDDSKKMFYKSDNVITCLRQQIDFDEGLKLGYDHIGLHGSVFMQWTGLKDKNGVEIYEGDLLETWRRVGRGYKENYVEQVHFSEITARWYPLDITVTEKCEILGNIFEHPHLVEKAKTDQV